MSIEKVLCLYLFTVNLLTFILFCIDKIKAISKSWRIAEKTLLWFSLFGGLVGAWFAMLIFRHKIKDKSFLPYQILITIIWVLIFIVFLRFH